MTIQEQIDRQIAELDAALSAKLGKPAKVRYSIERDRDGVKAWLFSFDIKRGQCVGISGGTQWTFDEALASARATIAAIRTFDDERADLYAGLPLPAKIEEAA